MDRKVPTREPLDQAATQAVPGSQSPIRGPGVLADVIPDLSTSDGPWDFSPEDLNRFPALRRRNFWCIQRHQARGEQGPQYLG